jgi:mannosyltransferase OCH1-like enzyme
MTTEKNTLIPKTIHLTWPTQKILDDKSSWLLKNGWQKLFELNPEWTVTLYEDEEIDSYIRERLDPRDYQLIQNEHIVAKTDIWRLMLLYERGGLYLDIDRLCNVKIDDVLEPQTRCVLPIYRDWDFAQDFMMSAPQNPIYMETLKLNFQRRAEGQTNIYLLGPQTYMHAVTRLLMGEIADTNPGEETFNKIREQIATVPFIQTYREENPFDTFLYRPDHPQHMKKTVQTMETWEKEKRKLYAKYGLRHWTNDW